MTENIKKTMGSIKGAFKFFFMDLIDGKSTRIQLLWGTFFSWIIGQIYFGFIVPLVREVSIVYYRQNSILNAKAIDMDSVHANTILSMLGAAFMGTIVGYIASNWKTYGQQDPKYNINKTEEINKKLSE